MAKPQVENQQSLPNQSSTEIYFNVAQKGFSKNTQEYPDMIINTQYMKPLMPYAEPKGLYRLIEK